MKKNTDAAVPGAAAATRCGITVIAEVEPEAAAPGVATDTWTLGRPDAQTPGRSGVRTPGRSDTRVPLFSIFAAAAARARAGPRRHEPGRAGPRRGGRKNNKKRTNTTAKAYT